MPVPDFLEVCGDLAAHCQELFCPQCIKTGLCDSTCGFCSPSPGKVLNGTDAENGACADILAEGMCLHLVDDCDLLFCPTCKWSGRCNKTCGHCASGASSTPALGSTTVSTTTTSRTTTTITTVTSSIRGGCSNARPDGWCESAAELCETVFCPSCRRAHDCDRSCGYCPSAALPLFHCGAGADNASSLKFDVEVNGSTIDVALLAAQIAAAAGLEAACVQPRVARRLAAGAPANSSAFVTRRFLVQVPSGTSLAALQTAVRLGLQAAGIVADVFVGDIQATVARDGASATTIVPLVLDPMEPSPGVVVDEANAIVIGAVAAFFGLCFCAICLFMRWSRRHALRLRSDAEQLKCREVHPMAEEVNAGSLIPEATPTFTLQQDQPEDSTGDHSQGQGEVSSMDEFIKKGGCFSFTPLKVADEPTWASVAASALDPDLNGFDAKGRSRSNSTASSSPWLCAAPPRPSGTSVGSDTFEPPPSCIGHRPCGSTDAADFALWASGPRGSHSSAGSVRADLATTSPRGEAWTRLSVAVTPAAAVSSVALGFAPQPAAASGSGPHEAHRDSVVTCHSGQSHSSGGTTPKRPITETFVATASSSRRNSKGSIRSQGSDAQRAFLLLQQPVAAEPIAPLQVDARLLQEPAAFTAVPSIAEASHAKRRPRHSSRSSGASPAKQRNRKSLPAAMVAGEDSGPAPVTARSGCAPHTLSKERGIGPVHNEGDVATAAKVTSKPFPIYIKFVPKAGSIEASEALATSATETSIRPSPQASEAFATSAALTSIRPKPLPAIVFSSVGAAPVAVATVREENSSSSEYEDDSSSSDGRHPAAAQAGRALPRIAPGHLGSRRSSSVDSSSTSSDGTSSVIPPLQPAKPFATVLSEPAAMPPAELVVAPAARAFQINKPLTTELLAEPLAQCASKPVSEVLVQPAAGQARSSMEARRARGWTPRTGDLSARSCGGPALAADLGAPASGPHWRLPKQA